MSGTAPAVFVSHGAPNVALEENDYTRALERFGSRFDPSAVVMLSAHWLPAASGNGDEILINANPEPPLIYDFGGFDPTLYRIRYRVSGNVSLAHDVSQLMYEAGIPTRVEPHRGLDHGVWVPLSLMYPRGNVSLVELSAHGSLAVLARVGEALRPLRQRGVALIGSGGLVHNLRRMRFGDESTPPEPWATQFEQWAMGRVEERDITALLDYRHRAPFAELAVPTSDHFAPVLFTVGAAFESDRLENVHTGFTYGDLSMRTFAFVKAG